MKLVLKEQYSFPGGAIKETVLFVTCLLKKIKLKTPLKLDVMYTIYMLKQKCVNA